MNYDLTRLQSGIEKEILIKETYSFSKEELEGTEILSLDQVTIEGRIFKNALDNIELTLTIDGTMILPCSITLKPVPYPFHIEVSGEKDELLEEMGEIEKKNENTLDIFPIIWENILMEIPMKVTSPDAEGVKLQGDGWKLVGEEENDGNTALEGLKDYYKKEV